MQKTSLTHLGEADFDLHTFESARPALVFFGAERCSVCQELLPTIEELGPEFPEVKMYWVDVDLNKSLFSRFRLRGIPTLLLFKDGVAGKRIGGLRTKEELISFLQNPAP